MRLKESEVGRDEVVPIRWQRNESLRFAVIVDQCEPASRLKRGRELLNVAERIGKKKKNPPRENQVVMGFGKPGVDQIRLPNAAFAASVFGAKLLEAIRKNNRARKRAASTRESPNR